MFGDSHQVVRVVLVVATNLICCRREEKRGECFVMYDGDLNVFNIPIIEEEESRWKLSKTGDIDVIDELAIKK